MSLSRLGALLPLLLGQPVSARNPATSAWEDWSHWTSPAPITSLAVKDSLLWMSTRAGLARIPIDGGPVTVYTTRNSSIPFDTLTSVDLAYEDEVLIGSPAGAVVKKANGSWTTYPAAADPLLGRRVSGFTRTPDGRLWLSTQANTIQFSDDKPTDFTRYPPDVYYRLIGSDDGGRLHGFDGANWRTLLKGTSNSDAQVESLWGIVNDGTGRVWVPTFVAGIERVTEIRIHLMTSMPSHPDGLRYELRLRAGVFRGTIPWATGFQATPHGLWASFYGMPDGPLRKLTFFPADTATGAETTISLDSLQGAGMDPQHPTHVFALDTNGNPWVLAGNILQGFDAAGGRSGTEYLPAELAAKGPFREMRFDRKGILFLRTDSAVFWKVKPKPVSLLARKRPQALRRLGMIRWQGFEGVLPGTGAHFNLQGRTFMPLSTMP